MNNKRGLLEQETCQDILSLLLLAKDKCGRGMTDEELYDELITLLFAGHETTASALGAGQICKNKATMKLKENY